MLDIKKNDLSAFLGQTVKIVIDRPLGSFHPQHPDIQYSVNYGYIPGIAGGDGEDQDVYLLGVYAPVKTYKAQIIAIIHRLDDMEDKLVAVPAGMRLTENEIRMQVHFQEQYFQTRIRMLTE